MTGTDQSSPSCLPHSPRHGGPRFRRPVPDYLSVAGRRIATNKRRDDGAAVSNRSQHGGVRGGARRQPEDHPRNDPPRATPIQDWDQDQDFCFGPDRVLPGLLQAKQESPMSGTKEIDKLYLERLDRNELLLQAAERAVLRGEMRPEAVADLHELYKDKCLVHDNEVTLNGRSLDDAVGELIRKRPLWRPPVDDPRINARKELESEALGGNVQAHGALWTQFTEQWGKTTGDLKYRQWCAEHAAAPGKKANGAADKGDDVRPDDRNPFTRLRTPAGTIDRAAEQEIAEITRTKGFAETKRLATEAGMNLSGFPLRRAS